MEDNGKKQENNQNRVKYDEDLWGEDFGQNNDYPPTMSASTAKKPKKTEVIFKAVGAIFLAVVFFFIGWAAHFYSMPEEARTLLWIVKRVEKNYYKELSESEWEDYYDGLYDAAMPDKFCSYYSPEEYQRMVSESQGNNADTGFAVQEKDGEIIIALVQGNSPADLAGLKAGMKVYSFGKTEEASESGDLKKMLSVFHANGGKIYLNCGYSESTKKVRFVESGEYLASYLSYRDSESSFDFRGTTSLTLEETNHPLIALDGRTAYFRFTSFDGNAAQEFYVCLQKMKERGRSNLILDLRSNGGGYLEILQRIASHLLKNCQEEQPVVAVAQYRNGRKSYFRAPGNDFETYFDKLSSRITVLADENTASASECLIGALYDYGTIGFGDVYVRKDDDTKSDRYGIAHSYGKGVMQSAFSASNGGSLRLTSAEVSWPLSGKSIHGVGVNDRDDGAVAIEAPLFPGETDTFLVQVIEKLCTKEEIIY